MSERNMELFLTDILVATFKIQHAVGNIETSGDLHADFIVFDAVLRELQIVGEATNNLIKSGILDDTFRNIVDFRNKITHEYFGVDHEIVWEVVKNGIPSLSWTIRNLISSAPDKVSMLEALECAEDDHKKAGQMIIVDSIVTYRRQLSYVI